MGQRVLEIMVEWRGWASGVSLSVVDSSLSQKVEMADTSEMMTSRFWMCSGVRLLIGMVLL